MLLAIDILNSFAEHSFIRVFYKITYGQVSCLHASTGVLSDGEEYTFLSEKRIKFNQGETFPNGYQKGRRDIFLVSALRKPH